MTDRRDLDAVIQRAFRLAGSPTEGTASEQGRRLARALVDAVEIDNPEIAIALNTPLTEHEAREADLQKCFGEDAEGFTLGCRLIKWADGIVQAELEKRGEIPSGIWGGEAEWNLYLQRDRESSRFRRALEVLSAAGFIEDPKILAEEDAEIFGDDEGAKLFMQQFGSQDTEAP